MVDYNNNYYIFIFKNINIEKKNTMNLSEQSVDFTNENILEKLYFLKCKRKK
jgi:hypothetical protein